MIQFESTGESVNLYKKLRSQHGRAGDLRLGQKDTGPDSLLYRRSATLCGRSVGPGIQWKQLESYWVGTKMLRSQEVWMEEVRDLWLPTEELRSQRLRIKEILNRRIRTEKLLSQNVRAEELQGEWRSTEELASHGACIEDLTSNKRYVEPTNSYRRVPESECPCQRTAGWMIQ